MASTPRELILLHGALGTADTFSAAAGLLGNDFQIFCPDLPGHGSLAAAAEPLTIDSLVAFLHAYIREQSIAEPRVFGFSMGGYVGLAHALKYPGVVRGVATLGTKYGWSPAIAKKEVRMLDADVIEAKVPALVKILTKRHGAAHWKSLLARTAGLIHDLGKNPILTSETVKGLHTPVCIFRGAEDQMVSEAESKSMAEALANARYLQLDGVSHSIEKIPPDLLALLIRKAFG